MNAKKILIILLIVGLLGISNVQAEPPTIVVPNNAICGMIHNDGLVAFLAIKTPIDFGKNFLCLIDMP
jgi:hypothetical protein